MADKPNKLPFVVQPRLSPITEVIGTDECGKIEMQRKGYLSVGEKAMVQAATSGEESIAQLYALAGRIARAKNKKQGDVFSEILSPDRPEYMDDFADEIAGQLVSLSAYQERLSLIQSTALLINRVDENWTIQDTMELHPDLIANIAILYHEEEQKSTEKLEDAQPKAPATKTTKGK